MSTDYGRIAFLFLFCVVMSGYSYFLYKNAESIVDKATNDWLIRRLRTSVMSKEERVKILRRQALWPLGMAIFVLLFLLSDIIDLMYN